MDPLRRAATSGAAFSLVSIVGMRAFGFLTTFFLTHVLNQDDFGRYALILSYNAVGVLVAGLGVTIIAPKLIAETVPPDRPPGPDTQAILRSFLTIAGVAALVVGLIVTLCATAIRGALAANGASWSMLGVLGLTVAATSLSAAIAAMLQGLHRTRELAIFNTLIAGLYLLAAIPAARAFGVTGAVATLAACHGVVMLAALAWLPPGARQPLLSAKTREVLARGVNLGWPLLVSSLALAMSGSWLRTWLGKSVSVAEVGRFQVADTLNQAILFVPLALATPLFPLASTMGRATPEERARVFGPAFAFIALLSLPATLVVGWGSRFWIGLFNAEYHAAWPVVYLLTAGYFLTSLTTITGALLAGFGLMMDSLKITVFWSALLALSAMLLAPRYGAMGVAAGYVVSAIIQTAVMAIYYRRRLGIRLLAAPRVLVLFPILFALGWWLLGNVSPLSGLLLAIPASGLVLLTSLDLTRRAISHLLRWIRPTTTVDAGAGPA
ncbi:MAG TPA: polysaccharide biosynthesis C-terminal domain-containing protein [Candidatus Eisenbacteria bacterium]